MSDIWDNCEHDWVESGIDDDIDGSVECSKCGCPGQVQADGTVYWPAT